MNIFKLKPSDKDFLRINECLTNIYPKESHRFKQLEQIDESNILSFYAIEDSGKIVGRFALYQNELLKYKQKKTLCIGNFECVNNKSIADELINLAKSESQSLGAEYLIGPMNGSTWMDYRFKTNDTNPVYFMEPEHPLYYNDIFLNTGFSVISTYKTFEQTQPEELTEKIQKHKTNFESQGIRFRNFCKKNPANEIKKIYDASLLFFENNFLYTPVSWKVFLSKYEKILPYLDVETQILAEDSDGNLVGFVFSVKDFYCKNKNRIIGKTLAINPSRKYAGLGIVIAGMFSDIAKKKNYDSMLYAFVIDGSYSSNYSSKQTEIYRNYALYGLEL